MSVYVRVRLPAQPVQLNVYPVKSLLHLFLWGAHILIARLFSRDEMFFLFYFIGVANSADVL